MKEKNAASEIKGPQDPLLDLYISVMADCKHKKKAMRMAGTHKTEIDTYTQLKQTYKNASNSYDELYLELYEKLNS